ncbi:MAG: ATP-binding protein, partial [Candidatus Aureabacteria bacterium]|nr:ATP-binding protein [Candidatus Auribacterota bacterium]
ARLKKLSEQLMRSKDRALERIVELRDLAQQQGVIAVEMAAVAEGRARKFTLVGAVMTLTSGLVLALYLSRSFSRPIRELDHGARLIGDGNFDHRLVMDTGDELEDLAAHFNAMASKLKTSYRELEERVRERTRELEESSRRLKRLFDGITDGISIIDRSYTILNANAGIAGSVRRREAELVGSRCHRSYNGSDTPCAGCPAADTFTNGTAASAQLRWGTRDMQIYIFPLAEEQGRVRYVIEYAKDISETKGLEQRLFQSEKLAAIGTLAAGVAHEIRNPLGIMKTSADMIRRNAPEGGENRQLAEFLIEEVDRLNRVVTRLLDFAKPSMADIAPCDVHDVLDRALALAGPPHWIREAGVVRLYDRALPPVAGDRGQLCQVFLNLILNAVQAMDGEGSLTLATARGDGKTVTVRISDTGKGIDEKILPNIFDPFFTTRESGSGLGLAVAYRIIEAHKGRIEVASAPGKGTTVTVSLPAG